jgi:5-(carboxyamino)imidazole ribonucleotide synthase
MLKSSIPTIGIVGGGQLAAMMAEAASDLGLRICIQTPDATDTAVSLADRTILAPIDDAAATAQLAQDCDWITFENEFVDLDALGQLSDVVFRPPLTALAPLLDKYDQRCYLQKLGLPMPQFCASEAWHASDWSFPLVFKARRHGYDGRGTFIVRDLDTLNQLRQQGEGLVEAFVPFQRELAVLVARSVRGEIAIYPIVETEQVEQVCRRVYTVNDLSAESQEKIEWIVSIIAESLQLVGLMGIELFQTADGSLSINELAPRTHNSGHLSIEACATSQFAQHLRAVAGMTLGDPSLTCAGAVMVNLLGYEDANKEYLEQRQLLAALPHSYVHWYGKQQSRSGRKLGHVTIITDSANRAEMAQIVQNIESIWYPHG